MYAMTGRTGQGELGVVHVVAISAATYFVIEWLKSKPFLITHLAQPF
jgi:hypothetical protein